MNPESSNNMHSCNGILSNQIFNLYIFFVCALSVGDNIRKLATGIYTNHKQPLVADPVLGAVANHDVKTQKKYMYMSYLLPSHLSASIGTSSNTVWLRCAGWEQVRVLVSIPMLFRPLSAISDDSRRSVDFCISPRRRIC